MSFLYDYQLDAVKRMKDGCILNGGVGSGKSRTSLYYYFINQGGFIDDGIYKQMTDPVDLVIITTAKKRDSLEWESELSHFHLSTNPELNMANNTIVIDSWNNIKKYAEYENSFFIFDEDRVVGKGAWVKAFLKIAKRNEWILLSATPGDTWTDYIPVFIANGFYRNRTEFNNMHVVWSRYTKFPKVEKYMNTGRLLKLRNYILVSMDYHHDVDVVNETIWCPYDRDKYKTVFKDRWNPFTNLPIVNAAELCQTLRRVINSNDERLAEVARLVSLYGRVIIFYNYNYELDLLKKLNYGTGIVVRELNGHAHDEVPEKGKWVYLVQYNAGAEGWNCTKTNVIIFFSQNYSYRMMTQAAGRIDRVNTPFHELYYYYFKTKAGIDLAIDDALKKKKKFNESAFAAK